MKTCPRCGQICQDSDAFCDVCGCSLSGRGRQAKKSPLPVLLGCFVAALILIVITVVCVNIIKRKQGNYDGNVTMERSIENRITVMENETESGENESKEIMDAESDTEQIEVLDDEQDEERMEIADGASDSKSTGDNSEEVENVSHERYDTMYVVNCRESITLRKSPSTSAEEICQIPFGSPVSYVETAENGFYKIIYDGKTGYGLASYLSTEKQEISVTDSVIYMKVVNCKESITLRKTPSTKSEQFCQVPLGAVVEYKGTAENGFYMISYNGYVGYALASYLIEW